jgi:hypothetical protein
MFAMYADIYQYTTAETRAEVDRYCQETGADWAMTFYDPERWNDFEIWSERNA